MAKVRSEERVTLDMNVEEASLVASLLFAVKWEGQGGVLAGRIWDALEGAADDQAYVVIYDDDNDELEVLVAEGY